MQNNYELIQYRIERKTKDTTNIYSILPLNPSFLSFNVTKRYNNIPNCSSGRFLFVSKDEMCFHFRGVLLGGRQFFVHCCILSQEMEDITTTKAGVLNPNAFALFSKLLNFFSRTVTGRKSRGIAIFRHEKIIIKKREALLY